MNIQRPDAPSIAAFLEESGELTVTYVCSNCVLHVLPDIGQCAFIDSAGECTSQTARNTARLALVSALSRPGVV